MRKRAPHPKEKKVLSTKGLLGCLEEVFSKIASKEPAAKRIRKFSLKDCLMSALAMFSLKSPSLLAFDLERNSPEISHNLKTLYRIK